MSFSRVEIFGNLTRDIELKYTPKGTAVCELGVAVNETWKDDAGEKQQKTVFVDVTVWGRQAETIAQWFKKGQRIIIHGKLDLDQWDDKQTGQKRSKLKVVLERFFFVDKAEKNENAGQQQPQGQQQNYQGSGQQSRPSQPSQPYQEPDDDDIPF